MPRDARSIGSIILTWAPRVLLALAFIGGGVAKLTGQPMMIANFDKIGLGQGFRIVTGVIEIAAAILILVPRTMVIGAGLMLCVLAGAFVAQLGPLKGDVIHVLVMAAIVGLALWLRRRGHQVRAA